MSWSPQTVPGLSSQSGSNARFTSRNSSQTSSPYSFLFHCVRARPSPCSPETEPPYSTTRSVTASATASNWFSPAGLLVSTSGRMCMQPGPACA